MAGSPHGTLELANAAQPPQCLVGAVGDESEGPLLQDPRLAFICIRPSPPASACALPCWLIQVLWIVMLHTPHRHTEHALSRFHRHHLGPDVLQIINAFPFCQQSSKS